MCIETHIGGCIVLLINIFVGELLKWYEMYCIYYLLTYCLSIYALCCLQTDLECTILLYFYFWYFIVIFIIFIILLHLVIYICTGYAIDCVILWRCNCNPVEIVAGGRIDTLLCRVIASGLASLLRWCLDVAMLPGVCLRLLDRTSCGGKRLWFSWSVGAPRGVVILIVIVIIAALMACLTRDLCQRRT